MVIKEQGGFGLRSGPWPGKRRGGGGQPVSELAAEVTGRSRVVARSTESHLAAKKGIRSGGLAADESTRWRRALLS